MEQRPTLDRINELLQEISAALNEAGIPYLVYGSYAYQHYIDDDNLLVNDIDIIVNQSDFENIQHLFEEKDLPYKLYVSDFTIHANHNQEIGNGNKPFDISFDSYDHYFSKFDIDISKFTKKSLSDEVVTCLMKKDDLMKIYEVGSNDKENPKSDKYTTRLTNLANLTKSTTRQKISTKHPDTKKDIEVLDKLNITYSFSNDIVLIERSNLVDTVNKLIDKGILILGIDSFIKLTPKGIQPSLADSVDYSDQYYDKEIITNFVNKISHNITHHEIVINPSIVTIHLNKELQKNDLLSLFNEKLFFPNWFGNNYDALYDCLRSLGDKEFGFKKHIGKAKIFVKQSMIKNEELLSLLIDASEINDNLQIVFSDE